VTCRRRAIGPRRHHCSWWHRELVEGYRLARHAQERRAEEWSHGYAIELADFYRTQERPLTFRDWLIGHRRPAEAEAKAA